MCLSLSFVRTKLFKVEKRFAFLLFLLDFLFLSPFFPSRRTLVRLRAKERRFPLTIPSIILSVTLG